MLLTKQLLVAININIIVFYTMEVNCSFCFFVFNRRRKKVVYCGRQPHLLIKLPSSPPAEVSKLLLSSHPTTCPLDPIPSHLLQAISPTLLSALTHIINTSLLTGTIPNAFKQARRTPLLKKPTFNISLTDSNRPVSLLPFIAETLELVVFNQLS